MRRYGLRQGLWLGPVEALAQCFCGGVEQLGQRQVVTLDRHGDHRPDPLLHALFKLQRLSQMAFLLQRGGP